MDHADRTDPQQRARALLDAVPPGARELLSPSGAERWAEHLHRRVSAAHPDLDQPHSLFAFVGARLGEATLEKGPDALHMEDLALAWGCLQAMPLALERFDLLVLRPLVRRMGADPDLAQRVREKLWVGRKLEEYAGRGPLKGWTRMVMQRLAINELRRTPPGQAGALPNADEGGPDERLWALADPELLTLQANARGVMKQALSAALAVLPEEDRLLLRLHHLEGIPHGQVGRRVGLPRSTVAFRLERARTRLFAQTRAELQRLIGERPSDVESVIRAVQGDLDLSLSLLRRPDDSTA